MADSLRVQTGNLREHTVSNLRGALSAADDIPTDPRLSQSPRAREGDVDTGTLLSLQSRADADPSTGPGLSHMLTRGLVPDLNPYVQKETRSFREAYMNRLGVFLFLVGMALFAVRFAAGSIPAVPTWVFVACGVLGGAVTVSLLVAQRRRQLFWFYMLFNLTGTALLTFLLLFTGTDGTFEDIYLLSLMVPALFFSMRWALCGAALISLLSLAPYAWGPGYNLQSVLGHLLLTVPVYFILTLCINLVMSGMREQWLYSHKQRRLARDLAVVQQLTTYIASTHDMQAICDRVTEELSGSFGYKYVSIFLVRGTLLKPMAQRGYARPLEDVPLGKGVMSRVVYSGEAVLIGDARHATDFLYPMPDIRCLACAPILGGSGEQGATLAVGSAVLGVVNLEDVTPGALGEADVNLIKTIASALSVALENAGLIHQWQERGSRLELVNHIAQAVAAKTDLSGVLRAARASMQQLTSVDRVTLSLITEDGQHLEVAALEGLDSPTISQAGTKIPLSEFQPASVLQSECLVIPELQPDSPYPFANHMYSTGLRSHVAIPLMSGEKVIGVFALSSMQPNAYTESHVPLLQSLAPHLATAVQNAMLIRDIKQRAETDSLTRLFNLPTFHARLNALLEESLDTREPLTVVMLDLDLFKSYNDSFGHVAGDSVLRQVAALIRHCLRPEDVAARYGGDEFTFILPGLAGDDALDLIARMCETIGRTPFQPETRGDMEQGVVRTRGVAMLSASAGLASFPEDSTDAEHLVHLADTALYEAKRMGRNRACAYNAFGPSRTFSGGGNGAPLPKHGQVVADNDAQHDASEARESRASMNDYLQAVYALVSAIELRDGYTHGHSERVAFYALRLGEAFGLGSNELAALRIAGLLHDIGKIALPYDILHKPGRLLSHEWDLVKQHPLHGEGILRPLRNFSAVWPMVSAHHENYDGTGYPRGMVGQDIPVGGRILRIADSYEVMTVAGRAYQKQAKSPIEAIFELRRCAGTMFDPELVQAFIEKVIGDPRSSLFYNPATHPLSQTPSGTAGPREISDLLRTMRLTPAMVSDTGTEGETPPRDDGEEDDYYRGDPGIF